MKHPEKKEEYRVWPPIAALAVVILLLTFVDTIKLFHAMIPALNGATPEAVYLFSGGMGAGLSLRLHGKYWLGFAWAAFLSYLILQAMRLLPAMEVKQYIFALIGSLALMFAVMTAILYAKRLTMNSRGQSE